MFVSRKILASVALAIGVCAARAAEKTAVSSPDGKNEIRLYANPLAYEVVREGVTVVAKSEIGLTVDGARLDGEDATGHVSPVVKRGTRSGVADAPVYKKSKVDLSANEAFADFGAWGVRLVARNDGVAYRFETKKSGKMRVDAEKASLHLPSADAKCWGYRTRAFGEEESVPFVSKAGEIDLSKMMLYLPFAYEAGGKYVSVTESDVRNYPIWYFGSRTGAAFEAKFAGAPKRVQKRGAGIKVLEHETWLVETEGTRTFPWRVFILADAPAKFCEADIVWALAPAQDKGADFSWVRPGKVAWDWWNGFDGGKTCDTKGYERFIDFAAKNGLEYVVLDWYGYEVRFGFNIWKPCPAVDVDHLVKYARERGVDLWHWMAFHQVYGNEERVASHFAKAGIKGFKVDFLDRGDAGVARFMEKFADACARNKMHVEYHGAYRPTGLHRRYPNVLNYEGIHGQEWMLPGLYKLDEKGTMFSDVAACYLRMTAGPMDYTPGAMNNHGIGSGFRPRDKRNQPGTLGTRCRQMAQVVLYEAPLQMLCDSPTNYEKNRECFAFMAKTPTVWKNTVGLAGTPDTMFVAARETRGGAWYAGGITTAEARDCTLDTSFLGAGEWTIEIFRDAGDAKEDAQRYVHETRKVKAGEKLSLHMAPGGGFVARCCRITPKSEVAEKPRKYLVGHGWDLLAVSPAEVARHADELSRTGLDGVSLSLRARLPDGRKLSFSSILTDPPWTREAFADQIPALKELHGKPGLSHCYLSAFWTPARRLRWDDDKAWALAIGNMKTLAQIAHEAQIEGLLIDPEDYSATKQFVFQNEDGDFDSTSRLARRRGGEFIDAVAAAHPRAKLLFFWLLSLSYHDFSGVADPQQFLKSRRDLWPAFVNGMLDRLPETMKLIDGDERAYRQEASRRDFYVAAWQQKQGMLPVVDVKNRDRFLLNVCTGSGHYLDSYINPTNSPWYFGPVHGSRLKHFEENIRQAVACAEDTVWVYGEKCAWIRWRGVANAKWNGDRSSYKTWEEALPGISSLLGYVRDPRGWMELKLKEKTRAGALTDLVGNGECAYHEPLAPGKFHAGKVPRPFGCWQDDKKIKGVFGVDTGTGVGDSTSISIKGSGNGCFTFESPKTKPGAVYLVRFYTKGSQPSVSIYWKRNGSWNWSLPGCFPTIGEAGSDGWRQGEMFVRVPENADSFCLLLGAKQRADEQIWFDRVNVHPLD